MCCVAYSLTSKCLFGSKSAMVFVTFETWLNIIILHTCKFVIKTKLGKWCYTSTIMKTTIIMEDILSVVLLKDHHSVLKHGFKCIHLLEVKSNYFTIYCFFISITLFNPSASKNTPFRDLRLIRYDHAKSLTKKQSILILIFGYKTRT